MRTRICICTILLALCHVRMTAQALATKFPPAHPGISTKTAPKTTPAPPLQTATQIGSSTPAQTLPDAPATPDDLQNIPVAEPVSQPATGIPVYIHAAEQEKQNAIYTLRGEVEIDYKDYVVRADRITYNSDTGDVIAEGHLLLDGGPDNEHISAVHGTFNMDMQTGNFYDVIGSVGVMRAGSRTLYTTPNPFVITGRELIKSGPDRYEMLGGSMTSCRLPAPHWRILAPRILVEDGTAKAWNSTFRLLGYPIVYLPYVTHAVDTAGRQSGFLIPELQTGSAIKGTVVGTAFYLAINRSTDLTLGLQYYSLRGFEQSAEFRYRGHGNDFVHGMYNGLEDRGIRIANPTINGQPPTPPTSVVNQGGQDTLVIARHDISPYTRAVINAEYLSSYIYREIFAENFSQAISSEVKSWAFLTQQKDGFAGSFDLERYENYAGTQPGNQIRILHLPSLQFDALDHSLGHSGFIASGNASFDLLSRSEPYYRSHNVGRLDFFPNLSFPLIGEGWTFRPTVGLRETLYSHSQYPAPVPPAGSLPGQDAVPGPRDASLTREAVEADIQILPPVLARDFTAPSLEKHFGVDLRHTIEPEINYRYVAGVSEFNLVPRFDVVDIYSDTNEVEYGLTQRLFLKRLHPTPCDTNPNRAQLLDPKNKDCGESSREWLSWYVGQKYFFDPTFGSAVVTGRPNIFSTTLDFSGISYITAPRNLSPVVSRLRINPSSATDLQWDFDYDTKFGRVAASNVFANYRHGNFFSSFGHSFLNVVGEVSIAPTAQQNPVNYNQMQMLIGYGALTRPGLSAAASGGFDLDRHTLEYSAIQANYNFDCCGFTIAYRRYELGSIRDESQESFSFTLAGVGAAGNLKRAERLF